MHKFSIKEVIIFGWEAFREHFIFLLVVMFLSALIPLIPNLFLQTISVGLYQINAMVATVCMILIFILLYYIQFAISMGTVSIMLHIVEKKHIEIRQLFSFFKKPMAILQYFLASILISLGLFLIPAIILGFGVYSQNWILGGLGLVLMLVFGFAVGVRLQFFTYFIVEKNKNCIDSLKASWNITKGNQLRLIRFVLTVIFMSIGVIALIVLIAFGLGLGVFGNNTPIGISSIIIGIVAYIVAIFALSNIFFLAHTHLYRKLLTATYK